MTTRKPAATEPQAITASPAVVTSRHERDLQLLGSLRDAFEVAIIAAAAPRANYYVVVVPAEDRASCHLCDTAEQAAAKIRETTQGEKQDETQVFVFRGDWVQITKTPSYLLAPEGRIPLFTAEQLDGLATDGFLGRPSEIDDASRTRDPELDDEEGLPPPA
jgi:hypothetical protein